MAKSSGLKRFFAQAKKTVPIKVGSKLMQFTTTQAVRLGQLADRRRDAANDGAANVLEQPRYSLEDAAFRLLQAEDILLAEASDGKRRLYVSIADLKGRWMCRTDAGEVLQSSVQTPTGGYLALMEKDVRALAAHGVCGVTLLEMILPPDPQSADLSRGILTALSAWGDAKKVFRLEETLQVDRSKVFLMAPLGEAN